jgi:hypothetical protein
MKQAVACHAITLIATSPPSQIWLRRGAGFKCFEANRLFLRTRTGGAATRSRLLSP